MKIDVADALTNIVLICLTPFIIIHELCHYAMCCVLFVKVRNLSLFKIDFNSGVGGRMEVPGTTHPIKIILISAAPQIICILITLFGWLLTHSVMVFLFLLLLYSSNEDMNNIKIAFKKLKVSKAI
jgi:hypothetical protein